jgi:hypothetical protein
VNNWNLYFVEAGEYLKIGIAKDVKARLSALQTGNPIRLELRGIIDNLSKNKAKEYEKKFHKFYKYHRESGEWFKRSSFEMYDEGSRTIIDGDGGFFLDAIIGKEADDDC